MELSIMSVLAFGINLLIRRKEAFVFRWQPTTHTWVSVATGLAAFGLSATLLLFEGSSKTAGFILYVMIWGFCGFAVPWGYTLLWENGRNKSMGLIRERLVRSLILNVALGAMFTTIIWSKGNPGAIPKDVFGKATLVLLTGNLFELFLYYGFIHLRLEKAFGIIPAIVITSFIYVLWHAGTQLPLEIDPIIGTGRLFLVGILYQFIFSLTRNLLAIWPFFVGVACLSILSLMYTAWKKWPQRVPGLC